MLMHKILQNHFLYAFVANLKIVAIYALYPESFCDKNLAIRKVFAFCDSAEMEVSKQKRRESVKNLIAGCMEGPLPAFSTSAHDQTILDELNHVTCSHVRRSKGKLHHLVGFVDVLISRKSSHLSGGDKLEIVCR